MTNRITIPAATATTPGLLVAVDKMVVDSVVPGATISGSLLHSASLTVTSDANPAVNSIADITMIAGAVTNFEVYLSATDAAIVANGPPTAVTLTKGTDVQNFAILGVETHAPIGVQVATTVIIHGRRIPFDATIPDTFNTGTITAAFFGSSAVSIAIPPLGDAGQVLAVNSTETGISWEDASGNGGGGASAFTSLTDTPDTLTANKIYQVNADGTALTAVDLPSGLSNSNVALLNELPSELGTAGQVLTVNAFETAAEWADASGGGGGGGSSTFVGLTDTPSTFGTAGQVLGVNAAENEAEWIDAPSGLPALGTAGQVLTVNSGITAAEWADPVGAVAVQSVVAYASRSDRSVSLGAQTWTFSGLSNYDDYETVNEGSFTTATQASVTNGAIVIPEAGVYFCHFYFEVDVNNESSNGSQRYFARGRIVTEINDQTDVVRATGTVGYSRGQYGEESSKADCEVSAVVSLAKGEELWGEVDRARQSGSSATSTVIAHVELVKVGGATGDTGAAGVGVPPIVSGDADKVLTVNSAESAAEWADATGATLTDAEVKTAYENNADTNAFTDAYETKVDGIAAGAQVNVGTNLGNTPAANGVAVTSSTGSNTTLPAATGTLAGVMAGSDKTRLDAMEDSATADQTNAEIKTAYEANADTNAFTDAYQTKVNGIETGATADQTDAEIKTAYENNADTNAFDDAAQSKLEEITLQASMAGYQIDARTFTITSDTPDATDEILSASGNGLTSLTMAVPNASLAATATVLVFREELGGEISGDKAGEFIITSRSAAALGMDDRIITLTGYLSDETVTRLTNQIKTFSLGSVGNDVRIHFLVSETATTYVSPFGTVNTPLGYGSDGLFGEISFPTELPALGTAGQVLAVNTGVTDVEWVDAQSGVTNLGISMRDFDSITITSSTGTNATIASATGTLAGLESAADKTKLNGIDTGATDDQTGAEIKLAYEGEADTNVFDDAAQTNVTNSVLDAGPWNQNLESTQGTAQAVANRFDAYEPNRFQEFVLGEDYKENEIAYYHRVFYLALNDLTNVHTVPSQDPTNWREFSTHRLEGYGDIANDLNVTTHMTTISVAAQDAMDNLGIVYYPLLVTSPNNFPQTILAINDDDVLEAQVDVVTVSFEDGQAIVCTVAADVPDGEDDALAAIALVFRGRVMDTDSWVTIKSASLSIASGNSTGTAILGDNDNTPFAMNTDDTLTLEMGYLVSSGSRAAGEIRFDLNLLHFDVTGVNETRHVISHGTGSNAGHITIEQSDTGLVTPIINLDGTPEWEGPLKRSRVREEQKKSNWTETDSSDPSFVDNAPNFDLPDTLGAAGQVLAVNATPDNVEWVTLASGNLPALGNANQILAVNAAETAAEWVDAPAGTVPDSDSTNIGQVLTVNSSENAEWATPSVGVTNLTITGRDTDSLDINSDTGTDVTVLSATTSLAGLQSSADKTKLNSVETGATADQTGAEIKLAYELNANTNVFTDVDKTKLDGIDNGAGALPTLGTAGQVLAVNSGESDVEWADVIFHVAVDATHSSHDVGTWDAGIDLASADNNPEALAVKANGDYISANSDNDVFYTYSNGAWDSGTALPSTEDSVRGIDVDTNDDVNIVGRTTLAIWQLVNGTWSTVLDLEDLNSSPNAIAINPTTGRYFVSNAVVGTAVFHYAADGTYDSTGDIVYLGLSIQDIGFNLNDELLISGGTGVSFHIYRWDGTPGNSDGQLYGPYPVPSEVLAQGNGIAVNPDGQIVLTTRSTDKLYTRSVTGWTIGVQATPPITTYDTNVPIMFQFPEPIELGGLLNTTAPVSINIDGVGLKELHGGRGQLTTGEFIVDQYYIIAYDGTNFQLIAPSDSTKANRDLDNVDTDLTIAERGAFAEKVGYSVLGPFTASDPDGNTSVTVDWDSGTAIIGPAVSTNSVGVKANGDLVVASQSTEGEGGEYFVFTYTGGAWVKGATTPGGTLSVAGVTVNDADEVVILQGGSIYTYTSSAWVQNTTGPSGATSSQGVAIKPNGDYVILDDGTNQVFTRVNGTWDSGFAVPSAATSPSGIAVAPNGNILIVDDTTDKIYTYINGAWDGGIGIPSGLTVPTGLTIDSTGNYYVADATTIYEGNPEHYYNLQATPTLQEYAKALEIQFFAPGTSRGEVYLNIDALGDIEIHNANITRQMREDELLNGVWYSLVYNGTNFEFSTGIVNLGIDNHNADSIDVTSSAGADATVPAATLSLAGLQSAADKTKLDSVETSATADQSDSEIKTAYENNSDTNAFTDAEQTKLTGIINVLPDVFGTAGQVLAVNDAEDTAEWHDIIPEFNLGGDYLAGTLIRYADVIYQATEDIADSNLPSVSSSWEPIQSHSIKGLGLEFADVPVALAFDSVDVAASNDNTLFVYSSPIESASGLPVLLGSINSSGWLEPAIDGMVVNASLGDNPSLVVTASGTEAGSLAIICQAGVDGSDWDTFASGTSSYTADQTEMTVVLTAISAPTFNLDSGQTLQFRLAYNGSVNGSRNAGSIAQGADTFDFLVSTSGTTHTLGFNSSGNIEVYNVIDDTTTDIIDVEAVDGPTYVGPVDETAILPGTNGQVITTVSGAAAWADSTELSIVQGSSDVDINSSTGTDVTILAATPSVAGVQSAADKTKLDGIGSLATGTTGQVLAINTDEDASEWVDIIPKFRLGHDYIANTLVRFTDIIYQATEDITDADAFPPVSSLWAPIQTHTLKGLGFDTTEAGIVFATVDVEAAASDDETLVLYSTPITSVSGFPVGIVNFNSSGWIEAEVDGVVVDFTTTRNPASFTVNASGTEAGTVVVVFDARIGDDGDWVTVVGGSATYTADQTEITINLAISLDKTFNLNLDETLQFRLGYAGGYTGSRDAGSIVLGADGFDILLSSPTITEHTLGFNLTTGNIEVYHAVTDTNTEIIDVDATGGSTYVGPVDETAIVPGVNDQILTTVSGASAWADAPAGLPALGTAGQVLTVNAGESESEWADVPDGTFLGLTDTPSVFGNTGQILTINAAENAAEWVDPADVDIIPAFNLGDDYLADTLIRYADVIYRATEDITDADTLPPQSSLWEPTKVHTVKGSGVEYVDVPVEILVDSVDVAASSDNTQSVYSIPINSASGLLSDLGSINSSGWLETDLDSIEVVVVSGESSTFTVAADGTEAGTLSIFCQAGVDGSDWATFASGTATYTADQTEIVVTVSTLSITFNFDSDESLQFRLVYNGSISGSRNAGSITHGSDGFDLLLSATSGIAHSLSFNSDGNIAVHNAIDDITTEIIEVDATNGSTYVGPVDETAILPGTNDQVLTTVSGATAWANSVIGLPTLGTTGQVLTVNSSENGAEWSDSADGVTNLAVVLGAGGVAISSSTGTDAQIPSATPSVAGVQSSVDKAKLDSIINVLPDTFGTTGQILAVNSGADDAEWVDAPNGVTNLSILQGASSVAISSDTGTDVIILGATTTLSGVLSSADKTKLDGIETSATADQTGAEIKIAYEGESDTNAFTNADKTKLDGISASNALPALGDAGQILAVNSGENGAEWVDVSGGVTNLAVVLGAGGVAISSSTGTDAEIPAATSSVAGVQSAADKTKLDGIDTGADALPDLGTAGQVLSVNAAENDVEWASPTIGGLADAPDSFGSSDQILAVNSGGDAAIWVDVASVIDGNVTVKEFEFGADYKENILTRYLDILYRATTDITDADTTPSTSSSWVPIGAHSIVGYGESVSDKPAQLTFNGVTLPALNSDTDPVRYTSITLSEETGLPLAIVSINDNGYLESHTDDTSIVFDSNDDIPFLFLTDGPAATIVLLLQGSTNGTNWTTIKGTLSTIPANQTSTLLSLSNAANSTWTLDTDDELQFRISYDITTGSRMAGSLSPSDGVGNILVTGVFGTVHSIGFDSSGNIQVHDSSDDTNTEIINVEATDGPTYVGPVDETAILPSATNGQVLVTVGGATAWSDAPTELPDTLGSAGQVLVVNSGETNVEWVNQTGGAAVSVVAYNAAMTTQTTWDETAWTNPATSYSSTVNMGGWTNSALVNGGQQIIIPEDGVYQIIVQAQGDVGTTNGDNRYQLEMRLMRNVSGTLTDIGLYGQSYSRGQRGGLALDLLSPIATALVDLDEDDQVYAEMRGLGEASGASLTLDATFSITKVGGAKGDTGATGSAGTNGTNGTNGTDGATGAAGTNGTNGTNGDDGDDGADGVGIPDSSGASNGDVIAWNSTNDAAEWVSPGAANTDTHPDISFPGLPTDLFIFDGTDAYNDVSFFVWRNSVSLTRKTTSGAPSASQYKLAISHETGITSTFTYHSLDKQNAITNIALGNSVPNGERRYIRLAFELLGDDANTYVITHELYAWKVDTSAFGTGTNLTISNRVANTLDINSSTGDNITVPAVSTTEAGLMTSADKVVLDNISPHATMAGREVYRDVFEIVSGTPTSDGEVTAATGNDVSSLVLVTVNDSMAGNANVILVYDEESGAISSQKDGEFFVTSVASVAVGLDYTRFTFTGYLSDETITLFTNALNTFSLGSVGNDVRLHFLVAEASTAYVSNDGTAGQVFTAVNGVPQWANAPAGTVPTPTLNDIGYVLTVNALGDGSGWEEATGGSGSVVAYSSFSDTTGNATWSSEANSGLANFDNHETVNMGGFSVATVNAVTNGRIVIPEDGLYSVRFWMRASVNNSGSGDEFWGRISMWMNDGTDARVKHGQVSPARGQFGDIAQFSTPEVAQILDLNEDDQLWAEFESLREDTTNTLAAVTCYVDILKIGGGKGDTGDTGAAGVGVPSIASATAGQVLTINTAEDAAEWADASGGSSLPSFTGTTAGQLLAVNSGTDGAEWVDHELFSRPEGRQYALAGRLATLSEPNQVRLSSEGLVYVSQANSNPTFDYTDVLSVGRVWELSEGTDYTVFRTASFTHSVIDTERILVLTVDTLESGGTLTLENGDTVTLTTEQRELPDSLGTAGQVLTIDSAGVMVEWADVPTELPTLGTAGQLLAVNTAENGTEWIDPDAAPTVFNPTTNLWLPVRFANVNAGVDIDYNMTNTVVFATIFELDRDNQWLYSPLLRKGSSNNSGTVRVSLYLPDGSGGWDLEDSNTGDILSDLSETDYATNDDVDVRLTSTYNNVAIEGYAMMAIQVSISGRYDVAAKKDISGFANIFDTSFARSGAGGITAHSSLSHTGSNALVRTNNNMIIAKQRI